MRQVCASQKLIISFGTLAALLAIFGAITLGGSRFMRSAFEDVLLHAQQKRYLASRLDANAQTMRAAQRGLELYTIANRRDKVSAAEDTAATRLSESRDLVAQIERIGVSEAEIEQLREARHGLDSVDQYLSELKRLCDAGDGKGAMEFSASLKTSPFESLVGPANRLIQIEEASAARQTEDTFRLMRTSQWVSIVLEVIALIAAVGVLVNLCRIIRTLRQIAVDLLSGAEQVSSATAQVATSAQELAHAASEQAASLQETSASANQVNAMTQQNRSSAQTSAQLVSNVAQHATDGNRKVSELAASMRDINDSSERVAKILKSVDEIAFRTNILALNAAVEAARAGESGAGFAVVADEVRELSRNCAQAAGETASLIQDSISKCALGMSKLEAVTAAISEVTNEAEEVKTLAGEVHLASQEQAKGLDQINRAISDMELVTQKNAATAEESAAASEQLNAQAATLREVVSRLRLLVDADTRIAGEAQYATA